jgi:hypothetical protein
MTIAGMESSTIRTRNVAMLVEQSGGPTEFGRRIDRDQAQVSQWTSATHPKPIGGRLARYIEEKLGHERGWLDAPQWEHAPQQHSQSVRLDPEMLVDVVRALQDVFGEDGLTYSIEEYPELFAEFYAERAAMKNIRSLANALKAGKWIERNKHQGMDSNERDTQVPAEGKHQEKIGGLKKA